MPIQTNYEEKVKRYIIPTHIFYEVIDNVITTSFNKLHVTNKLKKDNSKEYNKLILNIIESYIKSELVTRYRKLFDEDIRKGPRFHTYRLLQECGFNLNERYIDEDGVLVDVAEQIYSELYCSISNDVIEDMSFYKYFENPYLEWDIIVKPASIYFYELGDYRIRRYHELIADGTIIE